MTCDECAFPVFGYTEYKGKQKEIFEVAIKGMSSAILVRGIGSYLFLQERMC
jgi:hypothetical protein